MKAHNGMRPLDIVILLKMITIKDANWQYRHLADSLFISISEISESLHRSHLARLVNENKREVHLQSFMDFVQYGLSYVFPLSPGTLVNGISTAHSHPFYAARFPTEVPYVWPDVDGKERGLRITPLHPNVTKAIEMDEELYKLLASIDVLRVGRAHETKLAIEEIRRMLSEPQIKYTSLSSIHPTVGDLSEER